MLLKNKIPVSGICTVVQPLTGRNSCVEMIFYVVIEHQSMSFTVFMIFTFVRKTTGKKASY